MSNFYARTVSVGGGVATYPTFASFPLTATNGALALDLSTDILYAYNTTSNTWIEIGGPDTILGMGLLDGVTPSAADGAVISADTLYMQSASATEPGLVNTTIQTFTGMKTVLGESSYTSGQAALTLQSVTGESGNLLNIIDQFGATRTSIDVNGKYVTNNDILANGLRINGLDFPNTIFNSGNPISITTTDGNGLSIDTAGNVIVSGSLTATVGVVGYIPESEKGAANGVAPLGRSGKIALGYLPADVFVYQGTWTPSTNTPTLVDGTGVAGYAYWVIAAFAGTVAGLNNSSMSNFPLGGLVIYNGTQWELTPPALTAVSASNLSGGASNSLPYQTGVNTTGFLAQGTGVLQETAGAPAWTQSPALTTPTVTTQSAFANNTVVASTAMVQSAIQLSMSYLPLAGLTGGTVSFASNGSAAVVSVTAVAGVVTSVGVTSGGSGFAVGDVINLTSNGGNHDAYCIVLTVSGTAIASLGVLYGGTGYSSGTGGSIAAATTIPFTLSLSGTLTSNLTILVTPGTYLTQGNQWIFYNNTTGAYTTTVKMSNGSDTAIGTGVVIAQGTNNSLPFFLVTDGLTDVWSGAAPSVQTITLTGPVTGSGTGTFATTITAGAVGATQLSTGAFDQATITGGGGTAASVAYSPALKRTLIAGQTFAANTSYAVRWGITAKGETAGRVYAADITTSSYNLFYVIGMASSAAGVSAGGNIVVTTMGSFALSSADTAFASNTDGEAVFLNASGTFSVNAPSTAGQAVTRIGIIQQRSATVTSNSIDVWPQVIGIN